MQPLKGLILSGGKGTRLRPITHTSAKQLVPVANKPGAVLRDRGDGRRPGIEEVGIIIAPETGDEIREAGATARASASQITYVVQDEPLGLAHAVLTAEPFLGDDPFVMYLGDNLLQGGIDDLVRGVPANEPDALILLTPGAGPRALRRRRARRRPRRRAGREAARAARPTSRSSASTCSRRASTRRRARSSPRRAASSRSPTRSSTSSTRGHRVEPHIVQGWWKDTGRLDDMLEANRLILDTHRAPRRRRADDSQVEGRVVVEAGARLERSTVRGPAIIGAGAALTDAYVGPYTAIGADCVIEHAEVEHSILLAGSSVRDLDGRMESSLLGRNVHDRARRPPAARLPLHGRRQLGHRIL